MARQVFVFEKKKRVKRKGVHSKKRKPCKIYRGQGR